MTPGFAQEGSHQPLLTSGETVVVSFVIQDALEDDAAKILTVATAEDDSYIVYRFGEQDNIEIEYPKDKSDSWDKFRYSNYSRNISNDSFKLHLNYLEFSHEDVSYRVYDSFSEEAAITFVGVTVTKHSSGDAFDVVDVQAVSSSKIGSLTKLRDHRKIKTQSAFAIATLDNSEVIDSDDLRSEGIQEVSGTVSEVSESDSAPESEVLVEALVSDIEIQAAGDSSTEVDEVVSETLEVEIDDELVGRLELQIAASSMGSQELLQGVEDAFKQLRDNTQNPTTGISYWTAENETAFSNVRTKAQEIQEKYVVAKETVAQLRIVTTAEAQQQLLDELSTINNDIIELTASLEKLEAVALSSFEETQERFLNRVEVTNDVLEIDPEVLALEQEMKDLVEDSQRLQQGVQQEFNQLKQATLNSDTGVSYWTKLDEDALTNVRSQVQEAERNYDLATQSIAQAQTATTIEEQQLLVAKVFNHYEAIKEINRNLPTLESIAKSSFEASRTKYITRNNAQPSNASQATIQTDAPNAVNERDEPNASEEKTYRLLLGQCSISAYEGQACQTNRNLIYSLGYGVGEQSDGTVVAFVIGPFLANQISDIQAELLTVYGIASARVP